MHNLESYLFISALLFCLGVFGVMTRRNAIAVLMGVELILNAANINFVAFKISSTPIKTAIALRLVITPKTPRQKSRAEIKR
jgi:NADH:ubiquinone oxidoreductase subunit K